MRAFPDELKRDATAFEHYLTSSNGTMGTDSKHSPSERAQTGEQIWRNTLYGDREGERPLVVAMPITLSDGAKRRRLSRALDEYYNPRTYGRT